MSILQILGLVAFGYVTNVWAFVLISALSQQTNLRPRDLPWPLEVCLYLPYALFLTGALAIPTLAVGHLVVGTLGRLARQLRG